MKMVTRNLILAVLSVFALSSCSAELIAPAEEMSIASVLETEYNAINILSANSEMVSLPAITLDEAKNILKSLRAHKNAKEELQVTTHDEGDAHLWDLIMKQTIDYKYSFSIELHITSYDDGSLFYNGYDAGCTLDKILWKVGGFSFESDKNNPENFRFKSTSGIFLKIAGEDGNVYYYKVPVEIMGTYQPKIQTSKYTYTL